MRMNWTLHNIFKETIQAPPLSGSALWKIPCLALSWGTDARRSARVLACMKQIERYLLSRSHCRLSDQPAYLCPVGHGYPQYPKLSPSHSML